MGEILTGDYLTFKAPLGGKGKIGMIGKSTQKTRSGKNIFNMNNVSNNYNGISFSYENGIFTLNGTLQEGNYVEYQYFVNIPIKQGKYYRISFKELSGTKTGDGDFFIHAGSSINDEKTWGWIQTKDVLAKTPSGDGNIYNIVIYGVKAKNEQLVFNNYKFQVQIEEVPNANSPATEYEEYGAMPSPKFPSEIKNITTNVNVINTNENLVLSGYSTPKSDTDFWSTSSSGFTPLEDGWGRFELDNTKGNNNNYVNAFISFKKFKNIIKLKTSYKLLVEFRNINMSGSSNEDYMCITTGSGSEPFVNCQFYKNDLSKNLRYSKKLNPYPYDTNITHLFRSFLSVSPGNSTSLEVRVSLMEENSTQTDVVVDNQEFVFPLSEGQKFCEEDYLADDGIHHKRKQFVVDGTETIYNASLITDKDTVSFNLKKPGAVGPYYGESPIRFCNIYGEDYIKDWGYFSDKPGSLGVGSTTNQLRFVIDNSFIGLVDNSDQEANQEKVANWLKDNNIVVEEEVDEYVEAYTDEQQTIRNLMQNVALYEGTNNIFCTNEITPTLEVETSKLVDDFDFYISSNGYLVFPQYNKKYLTNMSENVILNMPEAVQTTVKIAGKDGDLVLDSSYNSQDFQVVMFTDEGLTPEQKEKERIFINRIFNAMKKNSKTFAFEQSQKFYKVLYSGILEETNYPQHMMFTIPLKSSKPYAYKMSSSYLLGNDTKTSETIEPVGFICTINGPALNPIISFNDYSMEFDNTISEGSKLIIDTNNSTAVLVNSEGIETNAMRYYNHQFPKIMEGENVLKVLSGIDNPNNVFISWYDLTL